MIFSLIKKEYTIIRKYMLVMLVIAVAIPPFFLWRMPEYAGTVGYILACIFTVLLSLQYVSQKECMYPKATVLLCVSPYPRKLMVIARYIFCLGIFIMCTLLYGVETILLPLGELRLGSIAVMLLVMNTLVGIYLPLQYKFGFEKTKMIFMIIIMSSPVLCAWLVKNKMGEIVSKLLSQSDFNVFICGVIVIISFAIYILSIIISVQIYNKADVV